MLPLDPETAPLYMQNSSECLDFSRTILTEMHERPQPRVNVLADEHNGNVMGYVYFGFKDQYQAVQRPVPVVALRSKPAYVVTHPDTAVSVF